ncbi:hypothetical protein C7212DRAFT_345360 [Tuber magnatum]|uniref:Uncharacterized protein n=1 Tax=Tuber magnatum TaxID=42249 RepID=A0A317SLP4_9PEZI|nr:hypothetical protein C7212DRAFT_345360 [Tuber magnatum]
MRRKVYSPGTVMRDPGVGKQLPFNVLSFEGCEDAHTGLPEYPGQDPSAVRSQGIPTGLAPSELPAAPLMHTLRGSGESWNTESVSLQNLDPRLRQPSLRGSGDSYSSYNTDYSQPYPTWSGTGDSYSSCNTDYSQSYTASDGAINPASLQEKSMNSDSQYHQTYLTDTPQALSPSEWPTTSFSYQDDSPAQNAGCGTTLNGDYFTLKVNHNYLHSPVRQEQHQLASGLQGLVSYPYQGISDLGPTPPPPGPPTHRDEEQDTVANHSNLVVYTDLDRHFNSSSAHSSPKGPKCPERGCKFTPKFTRPDNFKVHYKKQHGKSEVQADAFIAEWKANGKP